MEKNLDKSFVIFRCGMIIAALLELVISNIIIIQEIYTHTGVIGWSMLIIVDFLFFICIVGGAKVVIALFLSYDEDRVFASAREEIIAEQKSTMRRIAKIIRVLRY